MYLGIDFGTSNSAMAVSDGTGAESVRFADGKVLQRTVIFAPHGGPPLVYGNEGIERYYGTDMEGRLMQSLKSYLPSSLDYVQLVGARVRLEDLVTLFLRYLRDAAREATGETFDRAVLGRPVVFSADPEKDARAAARLRAAALAAGFRAIAFQYEPIAAALAYERTVTTDEIVLVGDLGGGTSDFAVVRVGPGRGLRDRAKDVLAVGGVPVAGNAFDSAVMREVLLPWFGKGALFSLAAELPSTDWSPSLLQEVVDLWHIPMLKDRQTEDYLTRMRARVSDPVAVGRLHDLIFKDLGFYLAQEIEATKIALSTETEARLRFRDIDLALTRAEFERVTTGPREAIRVAMEDALARAGLAPGDVSRVFLTGGTSQIPSVRRVFEERFARVEAGDVFTSVAQGLALSWPLLET
ncbi:MAG: Hsp70 family protein [Myxococcota bacterium]